MIEALYKAVDKRESLCPPPPAPSLRQSTAIT